MGRKRWSGARGVMVPRSRIPKNPVAHVGSGLSGTQNLLGFPFLGIQNASGFRVLKNETRN